MTNLEWLRTLDADAFADVANAVCGRCVREYSSECVIADCHAGQVAWLNAEHEEPDSWEKLETDVAKHPCDYWGFESTEGFSDCPNNKGRGNDCIASECRYDMNIDIVRRAKRLAGVE